MVRLIPTPKENWMNGVDFERILAQFTSFNFDTKAYRQYDASRRQVDPGVGGPDDAAAVG